MGVNCHLISLDDYYRNRSDADYPLTADGKQDLESPYALDIPLLNEHMDALDRGEEIQIPHFDFTLQGRTDHTTPLRMDPGSCVIFEGIHGLNDLFSHHEKAFRIYINDDSHIKTASAFLTRTGPVCCAAPSATSTTAMRRSKKRCPSGITSASAKASISPPT